MASAIHILVNKQFKICMATFYKIKRMDLKLQQYT